MDGVGGVGYPGAGISSPSCEEVRSQFNSGFCGTGDAPILNECHENRKAVLPPFDWSRIASIGFILGVEQGKPAWNRAIKLFGKEAEVQMGITGGGANMMMFDLSENVNIIGGIGVPKATTCATYFTIEGGISLGFDLGQGIYWGIVLSTAPADKQEGLNINISMDMPISLSPNRPNINAGISNSVGSCNYSAFYAVGAPSLPSISFTLSFTTSPLFQCEQMLEPHGYTVSELAHLANVAIISTIEEGSLYQA